MGNVKVKDEVIQKLIAEVEKRAKDVEAYELLLGMLKNIDSMNQLRGLVASKDEFSKKFRNKNRRLDKDDVDVCVTELFDFLKKFIKDNSSVSKGVNIVSTLEVSDLEFLQVSGLSKQDISPEVLDALKKTAASTVGTDLALQNPCCKPNNLVELFFANVSILELIQLMVETDRNPLEVFDKLGIKNSSNSGHRKLFSALLKSLSPALVEYSKAMVRIAVVDGVSDNLYKSNEKEKANYVSMQLVSFVDWFIRHPNENYVFGKISKDELKLMDCLKKDLIHCSGGDFSNCPVGQHFLNMCFPRFTLADIKHGIDVFPTEIPVIGGSKRLVKTTTIRDLFVNKD